MYYAIVYLVPSAPVVKDITAIDSESVQIEWYIPTDTNGILSIYTISYTVDNGPEKSLVVQFNGQNVSYSCIKLKIGIATYIIMYNKLCL